VILNSLKKISKIKNALRCSEHIPPVKSGEGVEGPMLNLYFCNTLAATKKNSWICLRKSKRKSKRKRKRGRKRKKRMVQPIH
jgi:hypothetical protein